MRTCDVLAAILLGWAIYAAGIRRQAPLFALLLYMVAVLAAIDGVFAIGCGHTVCTASQVFSHSLHDAESIVGAVVLLAAAVYDIVRRHSRPTILFVALQVVVASLAALSFVDVQIAIPLQYIYELALLTWLAWVIRSYGLPGRRAVSGVLPVRQLLGWVTLGAGVLLVLEAFHVGVYVPFLGHYRVPQELWLVRHAAVVGVVLLYLSRHIFEGQRRAAWLALALFIAQVLRYSLADPQPVLLALYGAATLLLASNFRSFDKNRVASTWEARLQDVTVIGAGIIIAAGVLVIGAAFSGRTGVLDRVVSQAFYQGQDVRTDLHEHRQHGRLFRAATTTLLGSAGVVMAWALFRPAGRQPAYATEQERFRAARVLERHSTSTEDYFKLWPLDKSYIWHNDTAFVAYKVSGGTAFVLADPIGPDNARWQAFTTALMYFRAHGWRVCVLMVTAESRTAYQASGLKMLPIGSAAVIDVQTFAERTVRGKWWRWQMNRAVRNGLAYEQAVPPHSVQLLSELRAVSDAWLRRAGHQEQSFAMGYFDEAYLQSCTVHLVRDATGRVVAFANQMPALGAHAQATVDLIRFVPDGPDGSMPVLMSHVITALHKQGTIRTFDLGFVPLAKLEGPIASLTRRLLQRRYSAAGLEQFKDKFAPDWQKLYIAYDGDAVELGKIAAGIEGALRLP